MMENRIALLEILLDLSRVREKNELISLFSSRINKLFHFTHAIIIYRNKPFLSYGENEPSGDVLITPLKSNGETIGFLQLYGVADENKDIINDITPQIASAVLNIHEEHINEVVLSLSNDMVKVRYRQDLLKVIMEGLKKAFPFSHGIMTETGENYKEYLVDGEATPVEDGIYDVASLYYKPLIFDMNSFDIDTTPFWFKHHYTKGAREMMVKILPGNGTTQYSLILFADQVNTFGETAICIIQRIASQLFIAVSNISANEAILEREKEQSFLLDFSRDIAAVRTKEDLKSAISIVLQKVLDLKLSMIRIIEDDGVTLSPYMYDESMFEKNNAMFKELAAKNIDIYEELSARVLNSEDPVIFVIAEEIRNGNDGAYIHFWKNMGLKNAFGARLRVGNTDVGTLWLLTDYINLRILKGICAQISIAISNIRANEKVLNYKQKLEIENDYLKEQIQTTYSEIVGSGAEMQKVYRLMSQVAESASTVLILGETGTGKELIARALHSTSPRKSKLMVKVNCAALPVHLIESELFGHEKGAFTGAIDRRIGKFELANNSTLFLDEIGEMPLELQVKLLRVIQEREFERIGGKTTIKVDVRIIAATNRDLHIEVEEGRFRSDLYYRLNVFPIHLPPLRERPEDIKPLANFFVGKFSKNIGRKVTGITAKVIQELRTYLWPGNVRELEHIIERSILLSEDHLLREIHLPRRKSEATIAVRTLEDMERSYIIEVLKRCRGKISGAGGAAEVLEIPGTTLHSKMKKLVISKADYFLK